MVAPELAQSRACQPGKHQRWSFSQRHRRADPVRTACTITCSFKMAATLSDFLNDLHDRCWLHGFGWHLIGKAGQLLDRVHR